MSQGAPVPEGRPTVASLLPALKRLLGKRQASLYLSSYVASPLRHSTKS